MNCKSVAVPTCEDDAVLMQAYRTHRIQTTSPMTFSASNGEAWPLCSDGVATVLTAVSLPPGVMRSVSEAGLHSEIALLGKVVWNMAAPQNFLGAKALKVLNIHKNKI